MIFKIGPYGKYMECTNSECKNRKPYRKSTGVTCPKCGKGTIVERKSKRGTVFLAVTNIRIVILYYGTNQPEKPVRPVVAYLLKKVLKKGTVITCSSLKCGYKKRFRSK